MQSGELDDGRQLRPLGTQAVTMRCLSRLLTLNVPAEVAIVKVTA